ncbi:MAG: sensor histidine kinase [Lachnospiraceae bacterium]
MLKKLRIKFVCINMTIITIMLVSILYTVIHFTQANLEQTNTQMLQEIASNPLYLSRPGDPSNIRLPYFTLKTDNNGNILESASSYYNLSDNSFFRELIDTSFSEPEKTGVLKDYNLRYLRVSTPASQFLIFMDISSEISAIENLTRNCIIIGIISFFAFLGISIFFANWAVRPVEKAWTQQKQFIADASHELKTPLTVILTNTELLKSPDYDGKRKASFSDNISIMAKQMQGLVEGLLELSRIDNGSMKTAMQTIDFSALVQNSVYLYEAIYFENELELTSDIENRIQVKGNEDHLKQVLEIFLDNALKYASAPSEVHVTLQRQRLFCILSVRSMGDSISEEDLKKIFQRFYRIDKSRNHSENYASESYGLGLSIAKSIVEEHHGKIWAESKNGVNTFYVRLGMKQ